MSRARELIGKTALSLTAVAGFLGLVLAGPFVEQPAASEPPSPPRTRPPAATPAASSGPGEFSVNGLPMRMESTRVTRCDPATWDPEAAGFCTGDCDLLTVQRNADTAAFAWLEAGAAAQDPGADFAQSVLHGLLLDCGDAGVGGTAEHFTALSHLGLDGVGLPPSGGPTLPRTDPIPQLPSATEVVTFASGGMTILIDRPRFPDTALEELQLLLMSQGWRLAGGPEFKPPPEGPPTRVFVRGPEMCVAALQIQPEDELLITAHSRNGWAPETGR